MDEATAARGTLAIDTNLPSRLRHYPRTRTRWWTGNVLLNVYLLALSEHINKASFLKTMRSL